MGAARGGDFFQSESGEKKIQPVPVDIDRHGSSYPAGGSPLCVLPLCPAASESFSGVPERRGAFL